MATYKKGLSDYELDKDHIRSRMLGSLDGSRSSRNRKMGAIDAVLNQAMDRDGGRNKAVSPEEFGQAMDDLVAGGVISEAEREKLHNVAKKDLND